jgi:glycosyltransferase involved in cell wall biosynthesis
MACGAPVITSNTSSMPEVAGDGAIIIDPYNPMEITEAMIQLLNDNKLREELIRKGFEQASKFSWKAMSENVLEIYKEIGVNNNLFAKKKNS